MCDCDHRLSSRQWKTVAEIARLTGQSEGKIRQKYMSGEVAHLKDPGRNGGVLVDYDGYLESMQFHPARSEPTSRGIAEQHVEAMGI